MTGTIPGRTTTYLNIAANNAGGTWDKFYAFASSTTTGTEGQDRANLTGSTGDDTFTGIGTPRTTYPSGMGPGAGRLTGAGYFMQVQYFDQVYANLRTGNKDVANLYDSNGAGTDTFWGNLHDAVLSDGTLDLANGNLLAAAGYYYRVSGFDVVNVYFSSTGGPNNKKVILPLDYVLAVSGPWIDLP